MKEEKETIEIGFNFKNTYVNLPEIFFTKKGPSHVKAPSLVKLNSSLAKELGLNIDALQSNEGIEILSGNKIPEGSIPLAQAYAGHQFGHFTLLGDGRALLLGEHITTKGERVDIQLKGSGRTPYSRGGDGKAALGPMLREYIISEAMHALNIPTTRSLAVTKTGEAVIRETYLKGAILTRVASSHIRVGTFQYARNWGTAKDIKKLADYTLKRHFKEIENKENPYLSLLKEVIKRQAELIAKWQLVGFIHGVMNTDNMTISGE
ncbi:MAG: protein adenylyltransferase SelO family protein, partial [Clostridium baratii]|nr:protein adenylyltransferase SelO family protein [Clostridium baratii]